MASHRIHRVEIEIETGAVEQGRALIERISQLHPRRIAPLIDRVCGDLSGPERLDRIDTLELDLGPIALDEFDDGFIRALEAALRSALARRLGPHSGERPESAALELLESFALTGNLPWWAERPSEGLIAERIQMLLDAAPERWFALLQTLADEPAPVARLAQHCDDPLLEAIARRAGLGSERIAELHELERWLADTEVVGSLRVTQSRVRSAWLTAIGLGTALRGALHAELLVALIGLAPSVLGPLRRLVEASTPEGPSGSSPSWLSVAAAKLLRSAEPPQVATPRERPDAEASNLNPAIQPASEAREDESENREPEKRESEKREPEIPESAAQELENREPENREPENREPEPAPAQSRPQLAHDRSPASDEATPASASTPASAHDPDPARPVRPARPPEPPARTAARRHALDRLETLYVDDAGLVILWPFLDRFFLRVGLLDLDRRFIDEQSTMQAIALLSQIAVEDPDPPEFRLPLAKLLCGLPPEAPFVLERPLVPEQIAECDRLLAGVIENAPILRDMSVASFRAGFVQRPAALSIREGAWLLEVEERPHDLVLERFAWSWSWVKLAWMPDPLFVRW